MTVILNLKALALASLLATLFCGIGHAQPYENAAGLASEPTGAQSSRLSPRNVIERALKAWDTIDDCRVELRQTQRSPSGIVKPLWAAIELVKPASDGPAPSFLINFFDRPIGPFRASSNELIHGASPVKQYFSQGQKIYTVDPGQNSVTIEWLNESGPLPEFLQLAGFLDINLDEILDRAYLDEVYEEWIDGRPVYRVKLTPRSKVRDVEPARLIWVDRETYLPVRFLVDGDYQIVVEFGPFQTNQGMPQDSLIPELNGNPYVNDLTQ